MRDKPRYSRVSDILDLAIFMESKIQGVTISEIAERYNVSRRTAERMRDSLTCIFPQIDEIEVEDNQKHWGFIDYSIKNLISFLPEEIAKQYLYGLSGVSLSLANYSQYSIIYQIYVKDIGWLPVKYNGQETMYSFDKPFCAIRINLVPNSQRQYLIDYWNKDC